jgi:hypothetical protein
VGGGGRDKDVVRIGRFYYCVYTFSNFLSWAFQLADWLSHSHRMIQWYGGCIKALINSWSPSLGCEGTPLGALQAYIPDPRH